jgi:nucleoside-diphosphate-sugar epimerase
MTVLILGATGFIGPHVAAALSRRGVEVVAASRQGNGEGGVALDRREVDAVRNLVRRRRIDTVIDLIAYTEADTASLLDALGGEVARWVMASSADVYRNYDGLHRKDSPPPVPGPLAEDAPLRTRLYPYRATPRRDPAAADTWMDDYDKIPLEAALRVRAGLGGTVLRLPMVFGPGDRQRRFRWIIAPMLAGAARIEADPGWLRFRTTYGYVADVADAIAAAALSPAAANRTFNLGGEAGGDHRDWIARFAEVTGWAGEVVEAAAPEGSPIRGLDLSYALTLDTTAFREACGWREPTALAEALAVTIEDEKQRGR